MNSRKTIGFDATGVVFKNGDTVPKAKPIYIRATYEKDKNFGSLSLADEQGGFMIQVTMDAIEKALRMAKNV